MKNTASSTWYVTRSLTYMPGRTSHTPAESLGSIVALLNRVAGALTAAQSAHGVVMVDETAATLLRLAQPPQDGNQPALDYAAAQGWSHTQWGPWISFYGKGRPSVYVGQLGQLWAGGERVFPFGGPNTWPADLVAGVAHWGRLTGVPWQAGPPVQGIEMMIQTMPQVRLPDRDSRIRTRTVERRDDGTPTGASEPPWTPALWRNEQLGAYRHGYDRRRAGLTAAGSVELAATKLVRSHRKEFDPTRAGWWLVSVPAWNEHRMPHPMGPRAVYDRAWVTTPTLGLVAELARQGMIEIPEIIDSMTGPARPVLQPWAARLEAAYQAPPSEPDDYRLNDQDAVRAAVGYVYKAAIGMLGHRDGKSQVWRPDWAAAISATKRCNGWRRAWTIGRAEGRWPCYVDDDLWVYVGDELDARSAAPRGLSLEDKPGGYRIQELVTR